MITDEMLYESAKKTHEALVKVIDDLPDCEYPISKRFERRMKRIIWRAKHKITYSVLKTASCILLVITLSGTIVFAFNVEARAAFISWIQRQYEEFVEYHSEDMTITTPMASYKLGWVPDGYTEDITHTIPYGKSIFYTNYLNETIKLEYCLGIQNTYIYTYTNNNIYTHYPVTVNDTTMDVYISNEPDIYSVILYPDNQNNILFTISSHLDKDNLIKMAENIVIQK